MQEILLSPAFITGAKLALVLGVMINIVPIMVWVERRGSALMQNRLGPNRVGPLGLLQSLADAVKFIFKEDRPPAHVNTFYWFLAPLVAVVPAFMTFAVIPFGSSITIGTTTINFQITDLDTGLLYVFAIASLGVYGIILAGWSSNNKYSLFGALRSSAQMISYEISLTLSVIGILMIFATVNLGDIAAQQGQALMHLGPFVLPKWGIFIQPLGFLIFLICVYAETNRLPFDMAEGESEIVAGYHLEYGAMKFALFFMAEYLHMLTASALVTTMYFGGWQMLPGLPSLLEYLSTTGLGTMALEWTRVGFEMLSFTIKVLFFMWLFVWVRWTLPRFRYDQLMNFGWKILLPLSLLNVFLTGVAIYAGWI